MEKVVLIRMSSPPQLLLDVRKQMLHLRGFSTVARNGNRLSPSFPDGGRDLIETLLFSRCKHDGCALFRKTSGNGHGSVPFVQLSINIIADGTDVCVHNHKLKAVGVASWRRTEIDPGACGLGISL
jgi:hypothetical protein